MRLNKYHFGRHFHQGTIRFSLSTMVILAAYLVVGLTGLTNLYQPIKEPAVSFYQTYQGSDLTKSLDLRLAAKAVYPSSPLIKLNQLNLPGPTVVQIISFEVPVDHLTEYGLMVLPASPPPAAGFPLIILCHAYHNPTTYSTTGSYLADMQFYAKHGFAVIKPDFRGQGLSSKQGQPEGAYFSMAYNTDLMSLISAVKQTTYLDKNSINLWGHSLGSYIALRASVLSPDIKKTILLSGPVGQLKEMFADFTPSSDRANPVARRVKTIVVAKYGTPLTNPGFWKYASPLRYLGNTATLYQIHVGARDKIVPAEFSAELDDALTSAHRPHQYFIYPGGGHGLTAQRPLIWSRSLEFLQSK